jgi:hydrogenase large subunit
VSISELHVKGTGVCEAARGSLVHNIEISQGKIEHYQIITPTQWNLSNGTKRNPGIAQRAMIGLHDQKVAEFIFRTFDVCSVCTTH